MPPVGLEPTIPASKRPHTYALYRAAIGIGLIHNTVSRSDRMECSDRATWIEKDLEENRCIDSELPGQTSEDRVNPQSG